MPQDSSVRGRFPTGFSLIEVLVTLVVISIGLLGLGSLQGFGLAMNTSSQMRLKAAYKAAELADRMRANQRAFDPALTGYLAAVSASLCAPGGGAVTSCAGSGCSPQQIAQNDLCEWLTDVQIQLPGGSGLVCVDSTPDDGSPATPLCDGVGPTFNGVPTVYALKLWWNDDKSGTPKRFVTTVRP